MTDTTGSAPTPRIPQARKPGYRIEIHRPTDAEAQRDRKIRWIILVVFGIVVLVEPIVLFRIWGAFTGTGFFKGLGILAGLGVAAFLEIGLLTRSLVYNPEWTAYVTQNVFTGTNIPYGPGLHPALPWEKRNKSGNYSLQVITRTFSVSIQTKTARVTAKGMLQYQVDLSRITNFIGIDPLTIEEGFIGYIMSFLTGEYADTTAEKARASIRDSNDKLYRQFMELAVDGMSPEDLEEKYGITVATVVIENLELPEAAQKARDAIDEAESINKVVAKLMGLSPRAVAKGLKDGTIHRQDFREMLNRALATSDNAKLNINVQEINLPGVFDRLIDRIGDLADGLTGGGGSSKGKPRHPKPQSPQKQGAPT